MLLINVFFVCIALVISFVLCYCWLRHHIVLSFRTIEQIEQDLKRAQREQEARSDDDANWRESFDKALITFNCSELTASKTEKRIKSMCVFPISFDEITNETVETTRQRFVKAISLLNKHSIMISGIEQGLLTVLETKLNGINQAVLSNYTDLLTQDLHSITNDLLTGLHSGHMPVDLQSLPHLAKEAIQGLENLCNTHTIVEAPGLLSSISSPEAVAAYFIDEKHLQTYHHIWDAFVQNFEKTPETLILVQHIDNAANHAGNILEVMHSSIHGHIPIFTLALSTWREIMLLKDKKTSWEISIKNWIYDGIGSGGGGLLGAKTGAITGIIILGPFFPGVGHAIGGVIGGTVGGIGGAMRGRAITNNLKKRPLEEAQRELARSLEQYEVGMKASINSTVHKLKEEASKQEMLLSQQVRPIPQYSRQLRERLAAIGKCSLEYARNYLRCAEEIIQETDKYTGKQWYWRFFSYIIPEYTHLLRSKALVASIIRQTQSFLPNEDMVSKHPAETIKQLSLVPLPIFSLRDNLQQGTTFVQEITDTYMRKVTQWSLDVLAEYRIAFESLEKQVQPDFKETREKDKKLKEEIREVAYKVNLARQALGLE